MGDILKDRNALITGASRGIGFAIATRFAEEGANLLLCSRNEGSLGKAAKELRQSKGTVKTWTADVTDQPAMKEMVKEALEEFGHIDILICNAGIADMALTWDITEEWWDMMLDVNLKGYWLAVKYVVPQMLAQQTGGRIIMTSSVAGLRGEPGMAHYCASKWGVIGLAKSLAQELAPHNITVNTLHPTAVNTDIITGMAKASEMATEELVDFIYQSHAMPVRLIEAEDVANAALWLTSEEARYVTGQKLKIDAGRMLK